jgi:hypothetical protein
VLISAALGGVINAKVAERLQCKVGCIIVKALSFKILHDVLIHSGHSRQGGCSARCIGFSSVTRDCLGTVCQDKGSQHAVQQ